MTTKLDGHYGSEKTKFIAPGLKGTKGAKNQYFVLVDEKTGEKKIYKNNNLRSDRAVGTIDKDNNFVPEDNAESYEKDLFNSPNGKRLINNQGNTVAANAIRANEGISSEEAQIKANELVNTNTALTPEEIAERKATQEKQMKADKNTRNKFPETLFYPQTLRKDMQDVIKFTMMKYEPKDVTGSGESAKITFSDRDINRRSIGSCLLPIPGGIRDNNQVSWNQENMDPIALAKGQIALRTIMEGGAGLTGSVGDIANTLTQNTGVKEGIANLIAGAASGTGGQLLTRTTGSVLNPNMELLFQGPQIRDFNFQFKLSPRDSKEAKEIIKIIRFFKQGMAPIRSQSRLFLKSPHTFRLQYLHERNDHPYLNKFKECALQSCAVTYGETQYSTYEDGVMSSYNVNLGFKELEPVFNDEYTELDGNDDSMIGY